MKKLLAMAVAVILAAAPVWGIPVAADDTANPEIAAVVSEENEAEAAAGEDAVQIEENVDNVAASNTKPMYRVYNPNSGEHFYTANTGERSSLVSAGWKYEGVGWVAPASGSPVYRLYNPNAGDHHYTVNKTERNLLIRAGWKSEGIGWYSGGSIPVYRQYNPNAKSGSHNYTTNKSENDSLVRAGWRAEGVAWYCTEKGYSADQGVNYYNAYHNTLVQLVNQKASEYSTWKRSSIISSCTYTLFDITGDGIKELIVSWVPSSAGSAVYIYSYNGKTVRQLDADIHRHEELAPAGNNLVYRNVNFGYLNVAEVSWNGSSLVRKWVASVRSTSASSSWYDDVYRALGCGTPFTMYPANDYSLLRKS